MDTEKNNDKLIVIGDRELACSINRALPYYIEHVDPGGFSDIYSILNELHKFKDITGIRAILLTDIILCSNGREESGIELVKHIRFTAELEKLCLSPLILLSFSNIMHHLKAEQDNILLLTPGCYLIQVPFLIGDILLTMKNVKGFETIEDLKNEIREYVIWSRQVEEASKHDNFNRYGPFKLMKECFGTVPQPLSKDYEEMTKKLWFKKFQFLEPKVVSKCSENFDIDSFQGVLNNKKILYIDDEHRLGWSFALHSIMFGISYDLYDLFRSSEHYIETHDRRFTCIDSYGEAMKFLDENKFDPILEEFYKAEHNRNELEKKFDKKSDEHNKNKHGYEAIKNKHNLSKKKIATSENELNEEISKLNSFYERLLELGEKIERREDNVAFESLLSEIKKSREKILGIKTDLSKQKEDNKRFHEELKSLETKVLESGQSLEEITRLKTEAEVHYNQVANKFKHYDFNLKIFDYDLILLDLRFDKQDIGELPKGIELLKKIKEMDPSIPVIIFTASEKIINFKEVVDLGASGYWIKVFNNVNDLMDNTIKCLNMYGELRKIWFNIKQIEAKRDVIYFKEDRNGQKLQKSVLNASEKKEIISLLKESFLLLQKNLTPYEESIVTFTNYTKIALNMALIQEKRILLLDKDKYYTSLNKWSRCGKLNENELEIRTIRQKAVHTRQGQVSKVSKKEALGVLEKTLDIILKN